MLFLPRLIKIKIHLRQWRRTEKLEGTTRDSTSEISRDSLSAIRSHEFSHRSPFVGWSVGRSVPMKLRGGESCSRCVLGFFIGSSISFPVRRHPSVDGGNKAPNKRFPSRWTERTNGKSDISMPRRPPSSCYLLLPHRTLAVRPPPSLHFSFDPSTSSYPIPYSTSIFLLFSLLLLHPHRTHSHIHRNWPLTSAGITISQSR